MKMLTYSFFAVIFLTTGCANRQVHWDAVQLRERALDYYTTQIMDNLIRGKNGMLLLHMDITALTAQVTSKAAGSVGGGRTTARTVNTGATGLLTTAADVTTKPFSFSISPERDDQLTITAVPEVNDPAIYQLYIQFLNLPAKPGREKSELFSSPSSGVDVQESDHITSIKQRNGEKLKSDDYVQGTLTAWKGHQYYVPIAYKQEYFDLCVGLVSRIKLKPSAVPEAKANLLPPKYDSPELRLLQQLQQKLNTLPQP